MEVEVASAITRTRAQVKKDSIRGRISAGDKLKMIGRTSDNKLYAPSSF